MPKDECGDAGILTLEKPGAVLYDDFENIKKPEIKNKGSGEESMTDIFDMLWEHARSLDIIDTHEHLSAFEANREKPTDIFHEYLNHYFNRDLLNAGLPPEDLEKIMDISLPVMKRWEIAEPYWKLAEKTGYGQAIDISVRELYGIGRIGRETVEEWDRLFQKSLDGGQYDRILRKKCRIKTSLLVDIEGLGKPIDTKYFSRVMDVTYFVFPKSFEELAVIGREAGFVVTCLDDLKDAFDICLKKEIERGAVCLKNSLAYERTLLFERATAGEAEEDFNAMFARRHMPEWSNQSLFAGKRLQDHMMHHILRRLNEKGLPIQIHTGLLEGVGNYIHHSDPALLSNLFLQYGDVKFDIFHIGYPFEKTLGALAKMFPNVYIDMCWAHVISPPACVHILKEWLETVTQNKISAFGGDYRIVDAVYGHLMLAKKNICLALEDKIKAGIFDLEEGKRLLGRLFYNNPKELFGLENL